METFNEVAAKAFKLPPAEIKDSLTPESVPEWDSMNFLLLIANLEKNFNITFSMDEVLNFQSLGDIRAALSAKGAAV
jgi:acyl carrier protein